MAVVKLEDICLKIGSGATPRGGKEIYSDAGVSLIRSQNVLDYTFSSEGLVHINDIQADKLKNVVVKENDVLLDITGDSVARTCIVDSMYLPARVNQHVCIIRANTRYVQGSYLLYFLQMKKQHLLQLAAGGATRNALTKEMICNLKVELPSLEEQRRITSLLDSIQAKIETNNRINDNLLEQAISIFNSNIATLPKNGQVGDYCYIKSGFAFKSAWWTNSGIKVIKIGSINQDALDLNACSYVAPDKASFASDFIVKGGDLLIAMTGATIGKFAMVPQTFDILLVNQRVGKFFLGENPIEKLPFIYCQLKQSEIANEIINRGQGSAQPNISASDIMTIPCVIPEAMEINAFNKTTMPMFEQIIQNQLENQQLAEVRDILLPKLMSGELDVSGIQI